MSKTVIFLIGMLVGSSGTALVYINQAKSIAREGIVRAQSDLQTGTSLLHNGLDRIQSGAQNLKK